MKTVLVFLCSLVFFASIGAYQVDQFDGRMDAKSFRSNSFAVLNQCLRIDSDLDWIQEQGADVLCLRLEGVDAGEICERFNDEYAQFIILDPSNKGEGGFVIASRYALETGQWDGKFFDFYLLDGERIGHFYLSYNGMTDITLDIIGRIENNAVQECVPFMLCGNIDLLNCLFRLGNEVEHSGVAFRIDMELFIGNRARSLAVITNQEKEPELEAITSAFMYEQVASLYGKNAVLMCKTDDDRKGQTEIEIEGKVDNEGNKSIEGKIKSESGDGKKSIEISGSVNKDKNGNTSSEAILSGKYIFKHQ